MEATPLPFVSYAIRIQPYLAHRAVRAEVIRDRGGEREMLWSGEFRAEEWGPDEVAATIYPVVVECLEASVEWMMWMEAERPV